MNSKSRLKITLSVVNATLLMICIPFFEGCEKSNQRVMPVPGYGRSYPPQEPSPHFRGDSRSVLPLSASVVRGEEVWFISRVSLSEPPDDMPGSGTMVTKRGKEQTLIPLPLKHTDVQARIDGYISTVEVTQQFHNPYEGKIEASYVFPLPHDAAVNEFLMIIGERRIRGIIRERAEAEKLYAQARQQGYVASLMTQERPNIFSQSVANIEPGKAIDVKINYFHTLPFMDGWYEFVFPMVVGPRFNPPGTSKGIGSAARGARGSSGQRTEVEYLAPGERSGHDIALRVDLNAGVEIEESVCRTHEVATETQSPQRRIVALAAGDQIPNRDFVLRFRVAGERIKSNLLTYQDDRGGFFTLMLYPPKELQNLARQPLELVFVLDCSGSMSGWPIEHAKTAIRRALRQMQPDDTFQIINFSNDASQMGSHPIPATGSNIRRGLTYVDSLRSEGGTMMITGIKAALDFPHDPERLRFVCFLTDGYIGNEAEILGAVQKRIGDSRIFSFGVGTAVNRYLLEHMAKLGRGVVAYLGAKENAATVMDDFFSRISHPAMTDLKIDWGAEVLDVFPRRLPDLFVGRPVVVTGRFNERAPQVVRISGKTGRTVQQMAIERDLETDSGNKAIPNIWARLKIADLEDSGLRSGSWGISRQVRGLALDYGLLSAYTAFVAVDSSRRTEGEFGTTVPVAVPVPQGVRYETTVTE